MLPFYAIVIKNIEPETVEVTINYYTEQLCFCTFLSRNVPFIRHLNESFPVSSSPRMHVGYLHSVEVSHLSFLFDLQDNINCVIFVEAQSKH